MLDDAPLVEVVALIKAANAAALFDVGTSEEDESGAGSDASGRRMPAAGENPPPDIPFPCEDAANKATAA